MSYFYEKDERKTNPNGQNKLATNSLYSSATQHSLMGLGLVSYFHVFKFSSYNGLSLFCLYLPCKNLKHSYELFFFGLTYRIINTFVPKQTELWNFKNSVL